MERDNQDPTGVDAVQRALDDLPPPHAPRTLLPRVIAAASALEAERARANAARPIWPRTWRLASIAALVLLAASAVWGWPDVGDVVGAPVAGALAGVWAWTVDVAWATAAVVSLTSILWNSFFQPLVPYLFVWIVLMSAACAAFGAALGRVALGGASHS